MPAIKNVLPRIAVERDGKVSEVLIHTGTQVETGDLLITLPLDVFVSATCRSYFAIEKTMP